MGIANSAKNVKPEMQEMKTDITCLKDALTKTINCVSELQEANNVRHSSNTPSEGATIEELTKQVLATITNLQTESKKSPEQLKIEELTKQLNQLKKRSNNDGGGGVGGSKKPYWEKMKEKMENRKKVYDPDPTCTKYCSLHGVQSDHDNGECPDKENMYWQADITFNNRKRNCCKKNLHKWHLGVKEQPVKYN